MDYIKTRDWIVFMLTLGSQIVLFHVLVIFMMGWLSGDVLMYFSYLFLQMILITIIRHQISKHQNIDNSLQYWGKKKTLVKILLITQDLPIPP